MRKPSTRLIFALLFALYACQRTANAQTSLLLTHVTVIDTADNPELSQHPVPARNADNCSGIQACVYRFFKVTASPAPSM
jgi:hypothetical protein